MPVNQKLVSLNLNVVMKTTPSFQLVQIIVRSKHARKANVQCAMPTHQRHYRPQASGSATQLLAPRAALGAPLGFGRATLPIHVLVSMNVKFETSN